ncbi:hypothetical protein OAX13_03705 [Planktomarina temperata]|nr:hypothetical protein [Planktomarina temperata]
MTSIDYEMLQKFVRWREAKMGREPRSSTLNTHNSALNRIFDEAVVRGYMNKSQVPVLVNKGRDSVRRPDFTREEYRYRQNLRQLQYVLNVLHQELDLARASLAIAWHLVAPVYV